MLALDPRSDDKFYAETCKYYPDRPDKALQLVCRGIVDASALSDYFKFYFINIT
jgi:hypothetical protein